MCLPVSRHLFPGMATGVHRVPLTGIPYNGILPRVPPPPVDQLPLSVPVFQILLSLVDRDLHGYALIKDIEQRTDGEVKVTASTLYGALARGLYRETTRVSWSSRIGKVRPSFCTSLRTRALEAASSIETPRTRKPLARLRW